MVKERYFLTLDLTKYHNLKSEVVSLLYGNETQWDMTIKL